MSDPLEQEIRGALTRRAAALPPDAAQWLTEIDYQAAVRPRWRRPALGAVAAALLAGVAIAVVSLTSSAPVAYAGWSPIPTTPTPAAVKAARAECAVNPGPLEARAGRHVVLTDARGRYTAVITAHGAVAGVCISAGRSIDTSGGGVNETLSAKPGPDQIDRPGGGGGTAPGFPGSTSGEEHVLGRAGSDVAAVKLVFRDGAIVEATVENGWYFAWWPYSWQRPPKSSRSSFFSSYPTSVELTTRSRRTLDSPLLRGSCQAGHSGCIFPGLNPAWVRKHPQP